MNINVTLVNRDGVKLPLESFALPNGKATPPYFYQYNGRIFLIDPMNWSIGSDTTPIIASYNEQPADECPDISRIKPIKKQEAA